MPRVGCDAILLLQLYATHATKREPCVHIYVTYQSVLAYTSGHALFSLAAAFLFSFRRIGTLGSELAVRCFLFWIRLPVSAGASSYLSASDIRIVHCRSSNIFFLLTSHLCRFWCTSARTTRSLKIYLVSAGRVGSAV